MKNRIWELDAARGFCILAMVLIHCVYDLSCLYGLFPYPDHFWFSLVQRWGGSLFFVISGVCAVLGSRPAKRGLAVFACGMVCTLVTGAIDLLSPAGEGLVIRFGVLHCLGVCMLLWPAVRVFSTKVLVVCGFAAVSVGFAFLDLQTACPYLYPLGLCTQDFTSADYFPIFPFWGFFLLGSALGRMLYRRRESRFPQVDTAGFPVRCFLWLGRNSLPIYLLHQPLLCIAAELLIFCFRRSL